MIREFRGLSRWLSNFHGGVEQKYQAAKCLLKDDAERILAMTPGEAKREGKAVELDPRRVRPDWQDIRLRVMEDLVREKFSQEPFRSQLLATGEDYLQEGNRWGDVFWGVDLDTGRGNNHLGKIIMKIRDELRS